MIWVWLKVVLLRWVRVRASELGDVVVRHRSLWLFSRRVYLTTAISLRSNSLIWLIDVWVMADSVPQHWHTWVVLGMEACLWAGFVHRCMAVCLVKSMILILRSSVEGAFKERMMMITWYSLSVTVAWAWTILTWMSERWMVIGLWRVRVVTWWREVLV